MAEPGGLPSMGSHQKSPDTPGSPEGNTEGPGRRASPAGEGWDHGLSTERFLSGPSPVHSTVASFGHKRKVSSIRWEPGIVCFRSLKALKSPNTRPKTARLEAGLPHLWSSSSFSSSRIGSPEVRFVGSAACWKLQGPGGVSCSVRMEDQCVMHTSLRLSGAGFPCL